MRKLIITLLLALLMQGCNTVNGLCDDVKAINHTIGTSLAEQSGEGGEKSLETIMNEKRKKIEKTRRKKDSETDEILIASCALMMRDMGYSDIEIIAATGVYVGGE